MTDQRQVTVRLRERMQASARDGLRQSWTEWQVVDGRRVVSRHDLESQARRAADARNEARKPAP